jgi:hypothetical protein
MDFIVSQGAARGLSHATPLGSIRRLLKKRRELNVVVLMLSIEKPLRIFASLRLCVRFCFS